MEQSLTEPRGWGEFPIRRGEEDRRAAAARARALLLALAKPRLAQQLVPFRLIVERNVEQAAPPVRTGRGASLRQDTNRALMPAAAVTTVLERIERASLEGTFIFLLAIRISHCMVGSFCLSEKRSKRSAQNVAGEKTVHDVSSSLESQEQ